MSRFHDRQSLILSVSGIRSQNRIGCFEKPVSGPQKKFEQNGSKIGLPPPQNGASTFSADQNAPKFSPKIGFPSGEFRSKSKIALPSDTRSHHWISTGFLKNHISDQGCAPSWKFPIQSGLGIPNSNSKLILLGIPNGK